MMTDCTAVGNEVVIMIMMMLSMVMMCTSLPFYDWLIVVPTCSLHVGWVGLDQLFGGLGCVWVDDMDPRTTLHRLLMYFTI